MNIIQTLQTGIALHHLMRNTKMPRHTLERRIHRRLKKVLVSAYRNVPYYRDLMKTVGYHPEKHYSGPTDLVHLPITTRTVFRQRGIKAFLADPADLNRSTCRSTSGSTGIPIKVYRSPRERAVEIARWLRVLFVNGYSPRHRVVSVGNPDRDHGGRNPIQQLGFFKRGLIDYYLPVEELTDRLLRLQPDVLYGNRSHLDLIALELKRRGVKPKGIKFVVGTGEVIYDSSRRLCRESFGADFIESYGSVELGVLAYETPDHDGLHLCEDLTYFEFLDNQGLPVPPGEPGRVVATDLTGQLMPFFRYDQGDRVVIKTGKTATGIPSAGSFKSRAVKMIMPSWLTDHDAPIMILHGLSSVSRIYFNFG